MANGTGMQSVSIKLDGAELSNDVYRIGDIHVRQPLDGHHTFSFVCRGYAGGFDVAAEEVQPELADLQQKLGAVVEIEASYSNQSERTGTFAFTGLVTNVEAFMDEQEHGGYSVKVSGHAPTIRLDDVPRNRVFENMAVSDWFEQAAGERGLQVDLEATSHTFTLLVQRGETDYAFARRMFAQEGLQLHYDGTKVCAKAAPAGEELNVGFGGSETDGYLFSFGLNMNAVPGLYQMNSWSERNADPAHVVVKDKTGRASANGHDFAKKAKQVSESVFGVQGEIEPEVSVGDQSLLDKDATSHNGAWIASLARGRGESDVLHMKAGSVLKVSGMGPSNGDFIVTLCEHIFAGSEQRHRNRFECCPVGSYAPPRERRPAAASTLWHAKVISLADPDDSGRVKVKLLNFPDGNGEVWARYATPYAGSQGGFLVYPELDDEVLVAFTDGDHRYPVIVGSVQHASGMGPGHDIVKDGLAGDTNATKVLVTRSGVRLQIDELDDGSVVTLALPDDQGYLRLADEGGDISITVHSEGKVDIVSMDACTVKADKDVTVESQAAINLKAQQDITIEATGNLTLKAGQQLKAEGSMMSELKGGSGTVKAGPSGVDVQGPMVKLN